MSGGYRVCAVVPTFDNPRTIRGVVERLHAFGVETVVVDDGSGPEGRRACAEVAAAGLAQLRRRERNGGKGAAVQTGFAAARELGCTHVLQVDADGQHDLGRVPAFLQASREVPEALVLGYPVYSGPVPRVRRAARGLTQFWVALEVGGRDKIRDAMIGFRVYPLAAIAALPRLGVGMDFDIEIAVRLVRAGTPTVNLPVTVRYLAADEGGVSHFRPVVDNLRLSWLHARICTAACLRRLGRLIAGGRR